VQIDQDRVFLSGETDSFPESVAKIKIALESIPLFGAAPGSVKNKQVKQQKIILISVILVSASVSKQRLIIYGFNGR